jgi:hypothetical protein
MTDYRGSNESSVTQEYTHIKQPKINATISSD